MAFPCDGAGQQEPLGAGGITARASQAALLELNALDREVTAGLDLTQDLPDDEKLDKVLALRNLWGEPALDRPPAAGVPRQAEYWDAQAGRARRRIAEAVENQLRHVENVSGKPVTVLGADGTLDERAAAFRSCIRAGRPVVSVSASGCLGQWLATRNPLATSLSILTYIPRHPLYAALVTTTTALLSDCSGSWRLTADGWQAMTGEPVVPEPAPGYIVLPRDLEHLAPGLRKHYEEPIFHSDTSSAIAQGVLGGAVPVAVHFTGHVLDSAIFPVAVGHGMIVRAANGELIEKPWDASRCLYKAITGEIAFADEHVIARDLWAARRAARALAQVRNPEDQPHPLDDPLDDDPLDVFGDDDLFGLPGAPVTDED
ncbi:hypothetical protein ACIRU8_42845 [Streptomyces sp. NPDC101175]|uniref:hypothetical protein n=1 Tax=Streptomyces sp. NPDC101175 TaxID=3366123 RepID=UPI0038396CFB